jgi:cell division transport system permease protein
VVAVATALLAKPIQRLIGLYGSQFQLKGLRFGTAALILGLSMALGWVGSWIAATRHIRAVEP